MDNPLSWLLILPIVILVVLSAFFSSTETAFACINQYKIRVQADDGDKKAKLILKTYERFDRTLITSLIGYNVCSVASSTVAAFLFFLIFKNSGIEDTWVSLISTAVMTIIFYMFCDMVPKMIARAMPERVARNNVYIANAFYFLFFPIVMLFNLITRFVKFVFKTKDVPALTEEDFTNVVEDIEEKGLLEDNESDIMIASLDFVDTTVREVLTSRNKVFYIDMKNVGKKEINNIILSTTFSRIPVCYGSIDKVVGILHVKTYIKRYLKNPDVSLLATLQKPYFVTTKIKLDDMLEGFKKHQTHIAIVKNDDKVVGIITMEDVLEELVGKIAEPNQGRSDK